jgi:DNA polymerase-3 subunit beta
MTTATATRTRITIEVKPFAEALAAIQGVIPTRSPRPILQNFLLRVDPDGGSTVQATDLEVGVTHRVVGVKAEAPLSLALVLDPRRFGGWLRATRDAELDLYLDGATVEIRGPTSQFTCPTEDPTLYPTIPEFPAAPGHHVAAADLRRLIRRTAFCCDPQSTRYALGGTLWERGPDSLTMVGTDGRRLAHATAPAVGAGVEGDPKEAPVVPLKALKLLERVLDDLDGPATVVVAGSAAFVRTERADVYARLVEGRFPRYRDVFPGRPEATVPFEAGTLLAAVEQAQIATSEESRGVDFHFAAGRLRAEARAADVGAADVELACAYEGPPLVITFDARYLADCLKVLDPTLPIELDLIDAKNAAVLRTQDGYQFVLMPLTRTS